MLRTLTVALLALGFCSPAAPQSRLAEVAAFGDDPGDLRMFLRAPAQEVPGSPRSLVVVLHGCGQDAQDIVRLSGWDELADRSGFWLLLPQQRFHNNPALCFNWFNRADIEPGSGETGSIASMVRKAQDSLRIAPERVHLYGVSAGGALAAALMACHPELFGQAAILGGVPYAAARKEGSARRPLADPASCTPEEWARRVRQARPDAVTRYPRLTVMHGTHDAVTEFGLGLALVAQWTAVAGTDSIADRVDSAFAGAKDVTRLEYHDAKGAPVLAFYRFQGMGHRLPVQPGTAPNQGGGKGWPTQDMGVHSTWIAAREFGLVAP